MSELDPLGFTIEERGEHRIIVWEQGGMRPATEVEVVLWDRLAALKEAGWSLERAGLREVVEAVLPRLDHWPENATDKGWNRITEPHSKWCPPCRLEYALLAPAPPADHE